MLRNSGNKFEEQSVGRDSQGRFEETVMPYLSAAYNLARWLMRNEHDAEDMVQESYLRALRSFHTFQAGRDEQPETDDGLDRDARIDLKRSAAVHLRGRHVFPVPSMRGY